VFSDHNKSWTELINEAKDWLNNYIIPYEFAGMVIFEDEHPLTERENESGMRNVVVYHTAGPMLKLLSE